MLETEKIWLTDRLFGLRWRAATGQHKFDTLCSTLGIDHRLTPPRSPQTNGMVERFNGRIEELMQSHHFRSGEELGTTLHRYVWLYKPASTISLRQQNALASNERLAQNQTGAVQETAVLPHQIK